METPEAAETPSFRALYDKSAAKPGAVEDHPWGETVFKVGGKIFVFLGGPASTTVTLKPHPDDREGLLALAFVRVAPYVGRYGWVTLDLTDPANLELALETLDASYEQIAAKGKRR